MDFDPTAQTLEHHRAAQLAYRANTLSSAQKLYYASAGRLYESIVINEQGTALPEHARTEDGYCLLGIEALIAIEEQRADDRPSL